MIFGIGTDITPIPRIREAMESKYFIEKCFTETEIAFIQEHPVRADELAAGGFSAKESVSKALGTGVRGFALREIEILRDELGKPYVVSHGKFQKKLEQVGVKRIFLSISHTDSLVSTMAVMETD